MDEDVKVAARARPWIVHQARTAGFETRDGTREIRHFDGDVMQPFAALVNELRDYRIRFSGFEQLNPRFTGRQHGDLHLFLFDGFAEAGLETELLFVEEQRSVQRAYGDAQVINLECV